MVVMDAKKIMSGKVIVILPNKKPGMIDIKDPKKIKPLFITPEMIVKHPIKKPIKKPILKPFIFFDRPLKYFFPFCFAPKMSIIKPKHDISEVQKSIICFA